MKMKTNLKRRYKQFQKRKTSWHMTGVQLISFAAMCFFCLMIILLGMSYLISLF